MLIQFIHGFWATWFWLKVSKFGEIMVAWHCHLQDSTVHERTDVKNDVNKVAFEI